ncbi:MAG: (Fe-S)-binding protein, partial [Hyphomicrobiaceae bacterium]|nr:(Fe-S)-binding protein [Hyphomicrobiaceae bacterium]
TVVIPECGHAFGVMRFAAANILGRPLPFEVRHITEYLADLKRQGRLRLKPMADAFTYHDPCQISRRGGATADARYLLDGFATDFREMSPTGNFNWCCGGGGGVQAMGRAADVRHKVFKIKMDQVEATGANTLISACSNCRLTMDESKAHYHWPHEIGSLVEILADHLDDTARPAAAAE